MDCYDDINIKEVTVMKSGQTGFTQAFTNMIGKAMHLKPGPIGVGYPTEAGVRKFSKRKFNQMIRDTEPLVGKIEDARRRKGDNSVMEKEFEDGFISMFGLGSPSTAASQTLRDMYMDEWDRMLQDVGGEGDIGSMLKMRQENFEDSIFVKVSTPTEKDFSPIEASYLLSDQRKYYVPCPHCKRMQILKFSQLKGWRISKGIYRPELTYYECGNRNCKAHLIERDKYSMLAGGKWRKGNPEVTNHAGFWINSLYSTLPKARWDLIVAEFVEYLKSGRNILKLKTFTNLRLGETFENQSHHHFDDSKMDDLLSRRENYGHVDPNNEFSEILLPREIAVLTAAADVQKNRIEIKVKGWGLTESWLIDYKIFHGDTSTNAPFDELDLYLDTEFKHSLGGKLRILVTCIDSRYRKKHVINFTRNRLRVYPIHGIYTEGAPLFPEKPNSDKTNPVGTFAGKVELFDHLMIKEGPGRLHFPEYAGEFPINEDYFMQLTAEKLTSEWTNGKEKKIWKKFRTRNEALDVEIYNMAAFDSLHTTYEDLEEVLQLLEDNTNPTKDEELKVEHSNYAKDGLYK